MNQLHGTTKIIHRKKVLTLVSSIRLVYRRMIFYLYRSEWYSAKEKPTVRILPHWNWTDETLRERKMLVDGKVPVRTFSNAASVELFLMVSRLVKRNLLRKRQKMDVHTMRELNQVNCILSGSLNTNQAH